MRPSRVWCLVLQHARPVAGEVIDTTIGTDARLLRDEKGGRLVLEYTFATRKFGKPDSANLARRATRDRGAAGPPHRAVERMFAPMCSASGSPTADQDLAFAGCRGDTASAVRVAAIGAGAGAAGNPQARPPPGRLGLAQHDHTGAGGGVGQARHHRGRRWVAQARHDRDGAAMRGPWTTTGLAVELRWPNHPGCGGLGEVRPPPGLAGRGRGPRSEQALGWRGFGFLEPLWCRGWLGGSATGSIQGPA